MITNKNRLLFIMSLAAVLLLMPFIAMQFSNEVNWTLSDFAVAAILLSGTGLLCELMLRKVRNSRYRIIFCLALVVMLILVWLELAVGIFGTPFAGS